MFFSIINPIDARYSILVEKKTGFYNITDAYIQYRKMTKNPKPIVIGSWIIQKSIQELIEILSEEESSKMIINLYDDHLSPTEKGIYVHRVLYNQFIAYMDPSYTIKMSNLLMNP